MNKMWYFNNHTISYLLIILSQILTIRNIQRQFLNFLHFVLIPKKCKMGQFLRSAIYDNS